MTSIYLSADQPRWDPRTEADLQAAIDEGLIEESHYLDLKEKTPSRKGDNKETARDLASFAIDGGTLIIGIGEDKENRRFFLAPQPLKGQAEKIEQTARFNTDPPLSVITQEIPAEPGASGGDADDDTSADGAEDQAAEQAPAVGYLVVHVPASPVAPHMVDGRYYGRGDKTKHTLPDPEVVRLHERRRAADRDALDLLQAEIDEDPIPAEMRTQAHLFLVAQPLAGRDDMLLDLLSGPTWNLQLADFLLQANTPELGSVIGRFDISPSLLEAGHGFRRGRGAARATPNIGEGRIFRPTSDYSPEDAVELRVHEDGGLRVFLSRFSDAARNDPDAEQQILDPAAVSYTRRFLALVLAAAEHAGYVGNWALAFGATGLRGGRAVPNPRSGGFGFESRSRYDQDDYRAATAVTWAELNQKPGDITRRLVGALLRALDTEARYTAALTDPEPTSET